MGKTFKRFFIIVSGWVWTMIKEFAKLTDAAIAFASLLLAVFALSPTVAVALPFNPGDAVSIIIIIVVTLFVVKFVVGVIVDRQRENGIKRRENIFNETTEFMETDVALLARTTALSFGQDDELKTIDSERKQWEDHIKKFYKKNRPQLIVIIFDPTTHTILENPTSWYEHNGLRINILDRLKGLREIVPFVSIR